ncbi:AGAP006883-PA-like protein [Anopheles sinensis]|uniref:AGAP006883-PA-like protein n=1 Tax=Anopheles sinensis TaxID=74873 RepID=A0A084W690_ANOSI|nr:AGAP006883-PA-like protein [Anopheles sinensis]
MELIKSTPAAGSEQQPQPSQSNVYDEIRQEIDKMDPYAETITLTYHLRQFAELFLRRINDDQTLNTLFAHLNEAALADNKFAVKMATVFGSHQLGDAMIQETKIRNAMIGTLQQNFLAIERLKQSDRQRFYNSVTLLGEYYNRKKVLHGRRINILGQSLLLLLTSELEQEITKSTATQQQQQQLYQMDAEFAKLLLEQITLNGAVAKDEHRKEITDLLFTIRKALITVPNLCSRTKAFLLMALDLYHSNLAEDLFAKLYSKYLNEPQQPAVTTTTTSQSNESVRVEQPSGESKQPTANGECAVRGQQEKSSPEAVVTPKATGIRANSNSRGTPTGVGKTPPSPQNGARTIHDKENSRRSSSRTKAAPEKKTPPSSQASKRNVRVSEDGKIVATITRDSPTTPTKKAPPSPTVGTIRTERSPVKKGLSPRLERLAALPKITITCSTPSPKRQVGNTSAISPRAVLGVASAKQQQQISPKQPPKSPIRTPTPKSVPEVHKSPEGSRQGRAKLSSPSQGTDSVETNKSKTVPRDEGTLPPKECAEKHPENDRITPKSSPSTEVSKETTNQVSNGSGHIIESGSSSLHAANDAGKLQALNNGVTGESVANGTSEGTVKAENTQEAPEGAAKPTVKSYFREDNMENLSWDAMNALDDDSPQKLNPHTKSFLSFLADH